MGGTGRGRAHGVVPRAGRRTLTTPPHVLLPCLYRFRSRLSWAGSRGTSASQRAISHPSRRS